MRKCIKTNANICKSNSAKVYICRQDLYDAYLLVMMTQRAYIYNLYALCMLHNSLYLITLSFYNLVQTTHLYQLRRELACLKALRYLPIHYLLGKPFALFA